MPFISRFWTQSLAFKKWFLPILSTKFHFQTFLGRGYWSTRLRKQEIQGLRFLNSLIARNTLECFTSSKNICIYKLNWVWPLDLALHLQSTAQIKRLDQIISIKSCPFDQRWSAQILSCRVWRKSIARSHPSNRESMPEMLPRVYQSPSGKFNFSRYNFLDEWLRLNRFKMNHRPITVHHVPPRLSEDQRSWFDSRDRTLHISPRHLHIKNKQNNPTWQK